MLFVASVLGLDGESGEGDDSAAAAAGAAFFPAGLRPRLRFILLCVCVCVCVFFPLFLGLPTGMDRAAQVRNALQNRRGETSIRISESARAGKNSRGTGRIEAKRSEARVPYQEGGIRSRGQVGSRVGGRPAAELGERGRELRCAGREGGGGGGGERREPKLSSVTAAGETTCVWVSGLLLGLIWALWACASPIALVIMGLADFDAAFFFIFFKKRFKNIFL